MNKKERIINISIKIFIIMSFMYITKKSQSLLNLSLFEDFIIPTEAVRFSSFIGGTVVLLFILFTIYLILNDYLISISLYTLLMIAVAFSNNIKVSVRNEFITYSELSAIFALDTFWPIISDNILFICLGLFIFVFSIFIAKYLNRKFDKKKYFKLKKTTRFVLSLLFMIIGFYFFENVENINNKYFGYQIDETRTNVNPILLAQKNGFVTSYLHTIDPVFMEKPEEYSKKTIEEIVEYYNGIAQQNNKMYTDDFTIEKTIIMLSEGFITSENFEDLLLSNSPTPFIDNLIAESGGYIYPKTIAGGTANTEFSVMSGFTTSLLDSSFIVPFSDFYQSSPNNTSFMDLPNPNIAIHTHTSKLYNRKKIYDRVGFDEKRFSGEGLEFDDKLYDHDFISDKSFFDETKSVLGQFNLIHGVTMQNHFPYEKDYPDSPYKTVINPDIYTEEYEDRIASANNYFKGTFETDNQVREFIDYIEKQPDKINLIFYGDHIPGKVIPGIPEYKEQQYSTPFFIYRNHDRKQDGLKFKISPAFLTSFFLETGKYKRPAFYYLTAELLEKEITEITTESIERNGEKIPYSELDYETRDVVENYKLIMYDSLFGSFYAQDPFFKEIQ